MFDNIGWEFVNIKLIQNKILMLLLTATLVAGCQEKEDQASQDLINAFASSCSSNGAWTQSALNHSNALISVLENLKKNDACKPLTDTLTRVQALERQLGYMLTNASYKDYRAAEEQIVDINLALNGVEPGSALDVALRAELIKAQVVKATAKGRARTDAFDEATATLGTTVQSMALNARQLNECFSQSPAAALQLATNTIALGGSFITPILGAGVSTMGQLVNGVVDYIRNKATNDTIWELYSAKMPLALTCGLESMTELYCEADDAFGIVELYRAGYPKPSGLPAPFWLGMDILNRRLEVLSSWIQKVKIGVPPTDVDDAKKVTSVWKKIQKIDIIDIETMARIRNTLKLADKTDSSVTKSRIISEFLVNTATELSTKCVGGVAAVADCGSGPFGDYRSDDYIWACWLVYGINDTNQANCPLRNQQMESLQSYVETRLMPNVRTERFETHWKEIVVSVREYVDVEFKDKVTLSPEAVLDQAFYPTYNSPRQALSLIDDFLENLRRTSALANPHRIKLIESVDATIKRVIELLDKPDPNATAMARVLELFKVLDLTRNSRKLTEELAALISDDIEARLWDGKIPQDTSEILRASYIDIKDRLRASGVTKLGPVVDDLNSARNISQANLEAFTKHFKGSFLKSLESLKRQASKGKEISPESPDGVNRPNGQTLAKLCVLMLSASPIPMDDDEWAICKKATLTSLYSSGKEADPLTLRLTSLRASLRGKPFKERVCTYHRFRRAERLAEMLEEKGRVKLGGAFGESFLSGLFVK